MNTRIERVTGREILDSRGNPTVEAEVWLSDGSMGRGAVPSGASTGASEALELRDGDKGRFRGRGVRRAVGHVNGPIFDALRGMDAADLWGVDAKLIRIDGTKDKSRLGANALLAASIACARAASGALGIPLYRFLGGAQARSVPTPMMNVVNGGAHAANTLDVQEFMIVPVGAPSFREGLRRCAEVFHALAALLKADGLSTAVGDEGGFAPDLPDDEAAIRYVLEAVRRAGYAPGADFALALDAAASEWQGERAGEYRQPKSGRPFTSAELIAHWKGLCDAYPICSIEDGLGEEDWDGWRALTAELGGRVQLVGDDLFVTDQRRLCAGVERRCANAILIKPNQIGTLSEAIDAVRTAHRAGYAAIVSHRSGETDDALIADLAVALNAGQIKAGAPSRGERVAKYNRLLRIEEEMGGGAEYLGGGALHPAR